MCPECGGPIGDGGVISDGVYAFKCRDCGIWWFERGYDEDEEEPQ